MLTYLLYIACRRHHAFIPERVGPAGEHRSFVDHGPDLLCPNNEAKRKTCIIWLQDNFYPCRTGNKPLYTLLISIHLIIKKMSHLTILGKKLG